MKSPARSPAGRGRGREHDRHSGTGNLGLPKKNGAGGKGVWGSEMDQTGVACLDKNDPNYDSDQEKLQEQAPQFNLTPPTNPTHKSTPTDTSNTSD